MTPSWEICGSMERRWLVWGSFVSELGHCFLNSIEGSICLCDLFEVSVLNAVPTLGPGAHIWGGQQHQVNHEGKVPQPSKHLSMRLRGPQGPFVSPLVPEVCGTVQQWGFFFSWGPKMDQEL